MNCRSVIFIVMRLSYLYMHVVMIYVLNVSTKSCHFSAIQSCDTDTVEQRNASNIMSSHESMAWFPFFFLLLYFCDVFYMMSENETVARGL